MITDQPPFYSDEPGSIQRLPFGVTCKKEKQLKLYVPISTDSNDSVKRGYAVAMITELAGCEVCIEEMGDSHADRACNKMANAFLKSDCDAMLVIDCDIIFRRADIDRMLAHLARGVKAVWGTYPKKNLDTEPCVCTFGDVPMPDEHGLVTVRRSGRGFMMVTREVLEALKEDNGGPALRYHNHGEIQWRFFWSGIALPEHSAMTGDGEREWISEDWQFCETIRTHLGIPTLLDAGIVLGHVGSHTFRFGGKQIVRMDSNISSWRDIQGWFDYEELYRKFVALIPDGGTFMEVGCWLGKSIAAFHAFAKEAGKTIQLHAVDTFCGAPANDAHKVILDAHDGNVEKHFRENMKALGIYVATQDENGIYRELTVHSGDSAKTAQLFKFDMASSMFTDKSEGADAVFIDADHSEAAVRADIMAWLPVVKHGGILAGHDYDEPGVKNAVDSILGPLGEVKAVGRCWVFEKH